MTWLLPVRVALVILSRVSMLSLPNLLEPVILHSRFLEEKSSRRGMKLPKPTSKSPSPPLPGCSIFGRTSRALYSKISHICHPFRRHYGNTCLLHHLSPMVGRVSSGSAGIADPSNLRRRFFASRHELHRYDRLP